LLQKLEQAEAGGAAGGAARPNNEKKEEGGSDIEVQYKRYRKECRIVLAHRLSAKFIQKYSLRIYILNV
jgi:hypothetical protein